MELTYGGYYFGKPAGIYPVCNDAEVLYLRYLGGKCKRIENLKKITRKVIFYNRIKRKYIKRRKSIERNFGVFLQKSSYKKSGKRIDETV